MKIIVVTPAGRKRYLKILFEYLEKQKTILMSGIYGKILEIMKIKNTLSGI